MEVKKFYESKTFWFNVLYAVISIAGVFGFSTYQADSTTVEIVGVVVAAINIALRLITTQPVEK